MQFPHYMVPGQLFPEMAEELFMTELDGPTFLNVEELGQYREWLDLCHAGS